MYRRKSFFFHKPGGWIGLSIILLLIFSLLGAYSVFYIRNSITDSVSTAKETFIDTFTNNRDEKYNQYYSAAYDATYKQYHVKNEVTISIGAIRETSNLEVLSVSDVVYIIEDGSKIDSGTSSWLKVSGTGVFTVTLASAEYIIDNERQYVLVRVPKPILDPSNIKIDNYVTLYFSENKWNTNNSVQSGEALARDQLSRAKQNIQEDFKDNEQYYKFAESSAKSMIAALIKSFNPDIPDLQVSVEFF